MPGTAPTPIPPPMLQCSTKDFKDDAHQHTDSDSQTRPYSCVAKSSIDALSQTARLVEEPRRQQFEHKPLDLSSASFRIIKVLPATPSDDTIRCTISHATVKSTYTCISYVWGFTDDVHPILIDDKVFNIRKNLWDFLKIAQSSLLKCLDHEAADETTASTFDLKIATPYFWIDALCIDQKDTSERNHQVQQMGMIFKNAQCVIAWLGSDPLLMDQPHRRTVSDSVSALDLDGLALETICQNNYWKRAWIIQELILAHNIYFLVNKKATNLASFVSSLERHRLKWTRSHELQTQVLDILTERNHRCTIFENLWRFRHKMCANLCDRVYSLLAISQNGHQLQVNYNQQIVYLTLEILSFLREDFCICYAKMIFEALLSGGDFRRHNNHSPFVRLHLPALKRCREENEGMCSHCGDWVDVVSSGYDETYYYCLSCHHPTCRVQAALPVVHHHGHIAIARGKEINNYDELDYWAYLLKGGKAKKTEFWRMWWTRPYMTKPQDSTIPTKWISAESGPYETGPWIEMQDGANVVTRDGAGSLVLDVSLPTFSEWASVPLKARFYRKNDS